MYPIPPIALRYVSLHSHLNVVLILLFGLGATISAYERLKDRWSVDRGKEDLIRARVSWSWGFIWRRVAVVRVRWDEAWKLEDATRAELSFNRGLPACLVAMNQWEEGAVEES